MVLSFRAKIAYSLVVVILLIVIGPKLLLGVSSIFPFSETNGYLTNLYTEIISIAYTYFLVRNIVDHSTKKRADIELRERLVREAGSSINSIARNAIDQLRKLDELQSEKSLLAGADLFSANLEFTNLSFSDLSNAKLTHALLRKANLTKAQLVHTHFEQANLQGADLEGANFSNAECAGGNFIDTDMNAIFAPEAIFRGANLSGASLLRANLTRCDLTFAVLRNTRLFKSNLSNAELVYADIRGADLTEAILMGANLYGIQYDSKTIFPDGHKYPRNRLEQIAIKYGARTTKPFWETAK